MPRGSSHVVPSSYPATVAYGRPKSTTNPRVGSPPALAGTRALATSRGSPAHAPGTRARLARGRRARRPGRHAGRRPAGVTTGGPAGPFRTLFRLLVFGPTLRAVRTDDMSRGGAISQVISRAIAQLREAPRRTHGIAGDGARDAVRCDGYVRRAPLLDPVHTYTASIVTSALRSAARSAARRASTTSGSARPPWVHRTRRKSRSSQIGAPGRGSSW